ncbi:MAG TPA: hypothetical protein VJT72_10465 [Pseudonocardiaceae bacterium]|nr:hypothetical protein [Pseudonocardiaceae bacterium]
MASEDWEQRLYEELRRVNALVCVVTSAFVASEWCKGEAVIAWAQGIRLLGIGAVGALRDLARKCIDDLLLGDLAGRRHARRTAALVFIDLCCLLTARIGQPHSKRVPLTAAVPERVTQATR